MALIVEHMRAREERLCARKDVLRDRSPTPGPPRRGHHVEDVERLAAVLGEPELFAARERSGSAATARYTLRESGLTVFLRHGSPDVGVLDEIFGQRWYDPPAPVARLLDARAAPLRVVDLGANIGLFGLWAAGRLGPVETTLYEPDRFNLAVLERTLEANGLDAAWRVVRACAAASPGTTAFHEGLFASSRAAGTPDAPGAVVVPVADVLPELAGVDLLKVDMEGGEWSVLADPRFAPARVAVVALEYHPHLCPGPHPRAAAEGLLRDAGYEIESLFERSEGVGMLWAWRRPAGGSGGGRRGAPEELGVAPHGLGGALEEVGLGAHERRGLAQRRGGLVEELGLLAHGPRHGVEELDLLAKRPEGLAHELVLGGGLLIQRALEELRLGLERGHELARELGLRAESARRLAELLHLLAPEAERVERRVLDHSVSSCGDPAS